MRVCGRLKTRYLRGNVMSIVQTDSTAGMSCAAEATEMAASTPRQWLSVFSVALGAFAFVTTEYLPVGVLPQIARELSVSDGTAGLMVTIPGIIAALSAPTMMIGAGKVNRRHLL